jgi:glycine/D-amino acid oxidase-like deaminating enzyme
VDADRVDVVIIGAGLAGSATAWAPARRGRSAVVLEAFQPGHRRGSSHGSARIFRRAYPDPLYVRLTGEAQRLWRQLADEAGEELVLTTGGLDFGPACSGHGAKFAPLTGEMAADLACGGPAADPRFTLAAHGA